MSPSPRLAVPSSPVARRALRGLLLLAVLALGGPWTAAPAAGEEPAPAAAAEADALDEALALAGLTRADLGWRARGWWAGYPWVQELPRHVNDLFDQPLATLPFLRGLGAGARDLLDPAQERAKGPRGAGPLFRAAHLLGVDRRFGALRSYAANLIAEPTPLDQALLALHRYAQRPTRLVTFGLESPYPLVEADAKRLAARLPEAVSGLLGRLVLDLLDAQRWADLAFRHVPLEQRARVARRLDLGAEEVDALDFEPAVDDVLRLWDEASLWVAGLKAVEALDRARLDLAPLLAPGAPGLEASDLDALDLRWDSPLGRVVVRGRGAGTYSAEGGFDWLVVDLGGDDRYLGRVAASDAEHTLSALLDLGGADVYAAGGAFPGRTQGAGTTGVGVLLDAAGDDVYEAAGALAQGAGQFGLGALIDVAGDDRYQAQYSAQGCGFFGVGLLFDLAGRDRYEVWSDGQGFGGAGGTGALADRSGDDTYVAVPDPTVTGRPSYHTEAKVSVSNAQGCSMGRRGDGADGHAYAGGTGLLLDAAGRDTYLAGNWAQGCGYWFGTGLLWDGGGDDAYAANGWAQGSGAHFCVGALLDEAGDDTYRVAQNWGPAYGHDFTVGLLADLGGDDAYEAGAAGLGWSINRSVALLLEAGGRDRYALAAAGALPGTAVFDAKMLDVSGASRYWTQPVSVGALVDAGGEDRHAPGRADGGSETDRPGSENARARNRGIFLDRPAGRLDLERPQPR